MNTNIFNNYQNKNDLLDISYDLLPNYINNMKGYIIEEFIYDIGNLKKLKFAENYVLENLNQFDFTKI
jgi:NDP-sugar pyrophosphorylase family protein